MLVCSLHLGRLVDWKAADQRRVLPIKIGSAEWLPVVAGGGVFHRMKRGGQTLGLRGLCEAPPPGFEIPPLRCRASRYAKRPLAVERPYGRFRTVLDEGLEPSQD